MTTMGNQTHNRRDFAITCVIEDRAAPPLANEHGLCLWISSKEGQMLFDTGGSGKNLLHNLRHLNFDPSALNAVALSHAHDDHTGGLKALLPHLPPGTPLYAHPTIFRPRYSDHGTGPEERGIDLTQQDLETALTLHLSSEPQEIIPGVWTTGEITERPHPEGRSPRHTVIENDKHIPDPYQDDLSLVIQTQEGLFVLCGCCHAGLLNTLQHVQTHWDRPIIGIGGGTHMLSASENTLRETIAALEALQTLHYVWLGHCSGETFIQQMATRTQAWQFQQCKAGTQIKL